MNRHSFAWQNLAFGGLFLGIVINWVAHEQDAFTLEELSIAAPVTLIVLGVIGIIATVWRRK